MLGAIVQIKENKVVGEVIRVLFDGSFLVRKDMANYFVRTADELEVVIRHVSL